MTTLRHQMKRAEAVGRSSSPTPGIAGQPQEYAGPLTMKHVGLCSQEGPEEKTGEIRFHLSGS
jgi:hypothetical protein